MIWNNQEKAKKEERAPRGRRGEGKTDQAGGVQGPEVQRNENKKWYLHHPRKRGNEVFEEKETQRARTNPN